MNELLQEVYALKDVLNRVAIQNNPELAIKKKEAIKRLMEIKKACEKHLGEDSDE